MSEFKLVKTIAEVKQLIRYCKQTGYASFDYETSSLRYYDPHEVPLCIGISFQIGSAWVVPLAHFESPFLKNKQWKKVLRLIGKQVLENWDITKIAWNIKFELKWCKRYGIVPKGRLLDAQLAKYCLDEERPNDLKSWVSKLYPAYGGYEDGKNKILQQVGGWAKIPLEPLAKYCGIDSDLTFRLMNYFEPKLIKLGFYNLFRNLLMMGTRVLAESEYEGMLIDRQYLLGLVEEYREKIEQSNYRLDNTPALVKYNKAARKRNLKQLIKAIDDEILEIEENDAPNAHTLIKNREAKKAGYYKGVFNKNELKKLQPLNWNSPQQVADFLYLSKAGLRLPILAYTVDKKTKKPTTTPSTAEETIEKLKAKDKTGTIKNLLNHRKITHLDKIYVSGMYKILSERDRVHASFKLAGTVTGRLSCLSGDTPIHTDQGLIPLRDLAPNKKGWGVPIEGFKALTIEGDFQDITMGMNQGRKELFEVELEDGRKIKATMDQEFMTDQGWMTLEEICDTDCSISKNLVIYDPEDC